MFKITDETREEAIKAMDNIIEEDTLGDISLPAATLERCFDEAVKIVMKQFGM